jgi:predicted Zn-dependent protease with MMP-like domain
VLEMSEESFESLVTEVLDELPDEMVDGLDNVVFLVEDEHPDEDLLGLYEGVAITDRGQYGFGELPDRIMIYRLPHLDASQTLDELRSDVRTTLVHEIAHFYGIDDEQLHELGWA